MDEQEFKSQSERALQDLYNRLSRASDHYGFEPDFNSGALSLEFEEPKGKFVVSPNTPVRQIWVSAHSKSFKLDWVADRDAFVLPDTGESLNDFIASAAGRQLGESVTL
jgi:iron donor protein CyaY